MMRRTLFKAMLGGLGALLIWDKKAKGDFSALKTLVNETKWLIFGNSQKCNYVKNMFLDTTSSSNTYPLSYWGEDEPDLYTLDDGEPIDSREQTC